MIFSVNSTAMSVNNEQEMKQTKYLLNVSLSAMKNLTTSDKNSIWNVFSTVNVRNLSSTVQAKLK